MNILSIAPFVADYPISPYGGGKGKFAYRLNSYLVDKCKHDVCVVPWKERIGGCYKQNTASGNILSVEGSYDHNWTIGWRYWLQTRFRPSAAVQYRRLREIIGEYEPDIVHLHYTASSFPRALKAVAPDVPLILTAHSAMPYDDFEEVRAGYELSDVVVFVSSSNQEFAVSQYFDVSKKALVIHNPASEIFGGDVQFANKRETVVFIGILNKRKNLNTLIRAVSKLDNELLVVCGDGPDRAESEQLCRDRNIKAVFLGHVSEARIKTELLRAKMLVVPSYKEGFAITYIEALCCGTPIIGFAQNIKEHEKVLGCRVGYPFEAEAQNEDDLAKLIEGVCQSKLTEIEYRRELARRARSYYSEEKIFKEYISLYSKIAK